MLADPSTSSIQPSRIFIVIMVSSLPVRNTCCIHNPRLLLFKLSLHHNSLPLFSLFVATASSSTQAPNHISTSTDTTSS
jgi:hypothetical protein